MTVTADFGTNVILPNHIALQVLDSWKTFINKEENKIQFEHNTAELYFEEKNMEGFLTRPTRIPDIKYVHPLKEHVWGQQVIRFYDHDRHIIKVGES